MTTLEQEIDKAQTLGYTSEEMEQFIIDTKELLKNEVKQEQTIDIKVSSNKATRKTLLALAKVIYGNDVYIVETGYKRSGRTTITFYAVEHKGSIGDGMLPKQLQTKLEEIIYKIKGKKVQYTFS